MDDDQLTVWLSYGDTGSTAMAVIDADRARFSRLSPQRIRELIADLDGPTVYDMLVAEMGDPLALTS